MGILQSKVYLQNWKTESLRIKTDNTTTAFNINRGYSAISLKKLTNRILEETE
jgi:hypothetical protein